MSPAAASLAAAVTSSAMTSDEPNRILLRDATETSSPTTSVVDSNTQALAFAVAALQKQSNNDDASQRLQRSRERNREHARRTRLRKKAHLQSLQANCRALQEEQAALRQKLEERRIASILLGLSACGTPETATSAPGTLSDDDDTANRHEASSSSKKGTKAASSDGVLTIMIDGVATTFNRRSHINWKSGLYTDSVTGLQRRLLPEHLEALRRERNRMHAKMTRDRKKCFIKTIQSKIDELVMENARLRRQLGPTNASSTPPPSVTSVVSPELSSAQSPATAHGFVLE